MPGRAPGRACSKANLGQQDARTDVAAKLFPGGPGTNIMRTPASIQRITTITFLRTDCMFRYLDPDLWPTRCLSDSG